MSLNLFGSMKSRILSGFLLMIAMLFVVGIASIIRVNSIASTLNYVDSFNSVKQRHAINFRGSVHDRAIAVRDVILVETSAEVQPVVDLINKLAADYSKASTALDEIFEQRKSEITDQERDILAKIKKAEAETQPYINEIIEFRNQRNYAKAEIIMMEKARPAFVNWLNVINEFIDLQEKNSIQHTQNAMAAADSFQMAMIILLSITTLIGILVASLVVWTITRSIGDEPKHVREIANEIANGNLAIAIDNQDADRESVISAVVAMRDGLANMISKVREGTNHITKAAEHIDDSNLSLSQRTDQQASSLAQIADSMKNLTEIVEQNMGNSRLAAERAAAASTVAVRSGDVITQMVSTMESINESSRKVADITNVIDGIAFQTNILALNAAVEAARAGEHGRGFAVVASEVRNLAQRSATAAKEIEALIGDSVERVSTGNDLVVQAGTTMQEVVSSVYDVTSIISQITTASEQQNDGIQQVGTLIQQMDVITHQNLSMVHEANDATRMMQKQILELAQLVAAFKTFDSETHAYANEITSHANHSTSNHKQEPKIQFESKNKALQTKTLEAKPQANIGSSSTKQPELAVSKESKTSKVNQEEAKLNKGSQKSASTASQSNITKEAKPSALHKEDKEDKGELKRPKVYNLGGQEVKSPTGNRSSNQHIVSDHDDWEEF